MGRIDYTGQVIGEKYRIIRLLGKGGMGAVYLGKHVLIGKQVGVKFLHAEFAEKEDMVKRFYREAQIAAAISHKNIIDVMDVGISEHGEPYLVMEYLEGESLSSVLKQSGPIDLGAACGVLQPTLSALAAAHDKGMVHRDLKPENIFLVIEGAQPPFVKLIDLGISKLTKEAEQSHLTHTGSFLGTPAYMATEQIRGASEVDHRADLYSVGVLLYEMLTGQLPFQGGHYNELLLKVMTGEPTPPREAFADFPIEAEELVIKLLDKEPDNRPQTAAEILEIIKSFSGYEERESSLGRVVSQIAKKTFAAGDLGETVSSQGSENIASDVLSNMAGGFGITPSGWSGTKLESLPKWRNGLLVGLVIFAVVVFVVGAGMMMFSPAGKAGYSNIAPSPAAQPASLPAVTPSKKTTQSTPDDGVKIDVVGIPVEAKVYYEDMLILDNPFRVKHGKTVKQLRIEAAGYEPYKVAVIPSKDQQIEIEMKPAVKTEELLVNSKDGLETASGDTETAEPAKGLGWNGIFARQEEPNPRGAFR